MESSDTTAHPPLPALLRHAMAATVNHQVPVALDEERLTARASALQTRLPLSAINDDHLQLTTTGSVYALGTDGQVAVMGSVSFVEEEFENLAVSKSPAAALAAAYERHGERVFETLNGAFFCCIYDATQDIALAAIDRLGQFPLYYHHAAGTTHFSSCASGVLASLESTAELSPQGMYHYIYFHMVPCPQAVYRGLSKLQAGHYLRISKEACAVKRYWLPQFNESHQLATLDTLSTQLRDTMQAAVQRAMPSSGKVGSFLSGGLDSSTVTGMLAHLSDREGEAYSIGFAAKGYDEMPFARITAKHFGVHLNEYYVTPEDVVEALPMVATSYDEPFGNSSALPAYFCAKVAAQNGVDTLLAGDGGDEFFAGNERYRKQGVFDRYQKIPSFVRHGLLEPLLRVAPNALPIVAKARSYISQANTPMPDRLQSYNFLHRHPADEIFSSDFIAQVNTQMPLDIARDLYERHDEATDLSRMLYLDWQITLADNDIRKVSHMCALAGVNVAYPMLDDELVAFSCQVPSDWKLANGDLRHFYKESFKNWLPDATINKSKQGFGLPFGVWMQEYAPLREMAYDNLLKLKARGFIKPEFIDKTIAMHQSEHAAYYGELVWILTVFELWMTARNEVTF